MLVLARTHQPVEQLGLLVVRPVFGALPAVKGVDGGILNVAPPFLHGNTAVDELAFERHLGRGGAGVGRAAGGRAIWMGVDVLLLLLLDMGVMGVYRRRGR